MITLIQQSHNILFMSQATLIEQAGRTCYKSEEKIGCMDASTQSICVNQNENPCKEPSCENHSSKKFIKGLIKKHHDAMLEHSMATVRLITNRGVTHEMVRHRLCAFAQESTRYVNYNGRPMQFIIPSWWDALLAPLVGSIIYSTAGNRIYIRHGSEDSVPLSLIDFLADIDNDTEAADVWDWIQGCLESQDRYERRIARGKEPEQARGGLINDIKTEIVVTANFREWRHIFNLRAIGTTGRPHPDMRALMLPLHEEFKRVHNACFQDIGVHMQMV